LAGLLALIGLAGCAGAAPKIPVDRTGEVLFERGERRAYLASVEEAAQRELCGAPEDGWPRHGVQRNIHEDSQPGQGFAWTMMRAGAVYLATGDRAAGEAVAGNLRRWAEGGALSSFKDGPSTNHYYNLDRTLLPTIISFWLIHDADWLASDDRAAIAAWLDELVARRGGPERFDDPMRESSRNNHRYLADSVDMAWGALTGDDDLFNKGVERVYVAIRQMREDGSLPLETGRGRRALFYQRHAVGSLVTIAEMAATQGIDLYAFENEAGHGLHRMVEFLVRGVEEPETVAAYAPRDQFMGFLVTRGHDRHYMAWAEAYRARFPESRLARRLWRLLEEVGDYERPLIDEYAGGAASCFYGRPARRGS